ncbi:MAG: 16S rRNA (uracil(1498)-N(3))-methyltransferase [Clostridiales bacterium]|nr:16S rRNA (uracil(1498)-N(3))-methyltransferase [Clostridiales bacterium]
MPRFFIEPPSVFPVILTGENARHISRSLRMTIGERLTLCDGQGTDYECAVDCIGADSVTVRLISEGPSKGEPSLRVTLYQGLPKSDKMELIVQKAVELGVSRIVPVLTGRSISRPDGKAAAKKQERWQKIALEAAKQCGRGRVPEVSPVVSLSDAVRTAPKPAILFYEGGGAALTALTIPKDGEASIFIGPEGGFAPEEVERLCQNGAVAATLGPRILRTETAPLAALTALMLLSGNMD